MKKTLSKILSVLLVVTVISGAMAIGASAVDSDTLTETEFYVAGTLISEGYYLTANGGISAENATEENYNVKFVPATADTNAKLTLNNAKNLSKTVDFDSLTAVILAGGKLDIELIGENTVTGGFVAFASVSDINIVGNGSISFTNDEEIGCFAVSATNISASNSVQINLNTPELQLFYGFVTENGTVTFKDSANVNMRITGTGVYSAGLKVSDNAQLTVDTTEIAHLAAEINGNVEVSGNAVVCLSTARKISGYEVGNVDNYALKAKNGSITICDNAQFNASAGDGEQSIAVYSDNSITVCNEAKLNAKSGNTSRATIGIFIDYSNNDAALIISDNARVTAESGEIRGGDDCYPYSSCAVAGIEANDIYISGTATLIGIGGSATELDDGSVQDDSVGICVNDRIDIDGEASIKGIGGTAEGNSWGILAQGIFMKSGCGAKLEGISNRSNGSSVGIECSVFIMDGGEVIGTGNTSVSSASCGIHIEGISVSDGRIEASASSGNTSFGLYSESTADFSGNVSVALKSADAKVISCGLYSESFSADQDVNIEAIGGDAEYAYGVAVTEATVTGNTIIDALAGNGVARSAGIYMYNSSTVNGNSKLTATAGKASEEYSAGIYSDGSVAIGGNAQIIATADTSKQSHGLAIGNLAVSSNAYVEAVGEKSAIYSVNEISPEGYATPYIIVSTDTSAENATEWDGISALGGQSSSYKYVLIAPESPEEPELSFFEKLVADITAFFNSIIEFLASLFVFQI